MKFILKGMFSLLTRGTKGVLSVLTHIFFKRADLFATFFDDSCMIKIGRLHNCWGKKVFRFGVFPPHSRNYSSLSLSLFARDYSTNSSAVVPAITYKNADLDKLQILKENKGKSGVYRWTNLVNGKSYIGSSANLERRLRNYYTISYLESNIKKTRSNIYSALLKHGYSNFSLEILEYVSSPEATSREQYYLDLLKPDYNILPVAGSRLGAKHSPGVIEKLKILSKTPEHIERLKIHNSSEEQQERLKIHNSSQEHLERLLNVRITKNR